MAKVTLHIRTEPYKGKDGEGFTFDGNKVVGEVKRGDKIIHTKEIVTDDTVESVCDVKESVAIQIELWAVQNTDFIPEPDCMPQ
jgi:hypothetical protein